MQNILIEGTAQEIMAHLAQMPPGERVCLVIARPSLSIIARHVQAPSASASMTGNKSANHMNSLEQDK